MSVSSPRISAMSFSRQTAFGEHYSGPVDFHPSFYPTELPPVNDAPPMFSNDQPRHSIDEEHAHLSFGNYDAPYFHPTSQVPEHGFYPIDEDDDHYSPASYATSTPTSTPISTPTTIDESRKSSPNIPKRLMVKPFSPPRAVVAGSKSFCMHPDCLDASGKPLKAFSRKADVGRHYRSQHERRYMNCPKKRCTRTGENGFTRSDHLKEHLRQYHQMPIPKRIRGPRRLRGSASRRSSASTQSV